MRHLGGISFFSKMPSNSDDQTYIQCYASGNHNYKTDRHPDWPCDFKSGGVGIPGKATTTRDFRIYPNPVDNLLTIKGGDQELVMVRLFGISGYEISSTCGKSEITIDVSNLEAGLYCLWLTNVFTNERVIRKVAICH